MLNHTIRYLLFHLLRHFLVVNTTCIARELHRSNKRVSDEKDTNEIIQTPSKASEFYRDQILKFG